MNIDSKIIALVYEHVQLCATCGKEGQRIKETVYLYVRQTLSLIITTYLWVGIHQLMVCTALKSVLNSLSVIKSK